MLAGQQGSTPPVQSRDQDKLTGNGHWGLGLLKLSGPSPLRNNEQAWANLLLSFTLFLSHTQGTRLFGTRSLHLLPFKAEGSLPLPGSSPSTKHTQPNSMPLPCQTEHGNLWEGMGTGTTCPVSVSPCMAPGVE